MYIIACYYIASYIVVFYIVAMHVFVVLQLAMCVVSYVYPVAILFVLLYTM